MKVKRNTQVIIRLSNEENNNLKKLVSKTGLSQSEYIRQLISGKNPRAIPPSEFRDMLGCLYSIDNKLIKIIDFAKENGFIEDSIVEDANFMVKNAIVKITKAVLEPESGKS